jgi:hypothetical protein
MRVPNRRAVGSTIPKASQNVRAARGVALQLYDLNRRKGEVLERVERAREALERVDVFGLRRELEDALREQADIETRLTELQAATS